MAGNNPFKVFRKNQKLWLAILGVGTIIAFIIIPALMQLFSGYGGAGPSDVAKTRKFGTVNELTVQALSQNRRSLGAFYEVLFRNLISPDGSNAQQLQALWNRANAYSQSGNEESLVTHWLLSQYAKEQGIKVGLETIQSHLVGLTGGLISDQALDDTLKAVGMNERQLENLLANDISVDQLQTSFDISQMSVTPLTRWDWFQRMNRQITAEVAAVPVDRFVSQVSDPSDAELRKFFEDNKDTVFDPSQSESGFTVPQQVAFQYVKAVPGQKLLDSITDEDIAKYYEANKEPMFRKPVSPAPERPMLPGQDSGSIFRPNLGGFTPGSGSRPFPTPMTRPVRRSDNAVTVTNGDAETKTEEKVSETPAAQPVDETKPAEQPKEEPKAEEKPAETKPVDESKTEEKKDESSFIKRNVQFRLVSYQAENEAASGANPPAEQAKEEPKAEEKPAETKPVEQSKEESKVEETPVENKTDSTVDLSVLYKPLSEVKEEIRQILAQEKALQAVETIESKMREYSKDYYKHVDQGFPAPAMPDLGVLAEEQGLQLEEVEKGNFYDASRSQFARGMREKDYLRVLYGGSPIQFDPNFIEGDEGRVLLWVTELEPEFKPAKLEDVKDAVLARWKEIKARPLAQKKAEELAAEARSGGKSLTETFASNNEVQVVETEPFTWMTYGPGVHPLLAAMQGSPIRIDEVREKGVAVGNAEIDNKQIFAPGNDFMEGIYALQIGETGVVFNQPQNTAYVVRVTGSSPSEEALWDRFQTAYPQEYIQAGRPQEMRQAWDIWLKKIKDETGFQWLRKPR